MVLNHSISRVTATTAMVPNTEVALQACLSSDILFDCKLHAAIYWEEVGIESPGGIQQADGSIIWRGGRVALVVCWVGYGLSLSHELISVNHFARSPEHYPEQDINNSGGKRASCQEPLHLKVIIKNCCNAEVTSSLVVKMEGNSQDSN